MGSARWILLVLVAAAMAVCTFHRGSRLAVEFALLEARLGISGAGAEDYYRLAEREADEGGSLQRVERLCRRAEGMQPGGWRSSLIILKAKLFPIVVRDMENALTLGDRFAKAGDRENAAREYGEVVRWESAFSSPEIRQRAGRARLGLARLPSPGN